MIKAKHDILLPPSPSASVALDDKDTDCCLGVLGWGKFICRVFIGCPILFILYSKGFPITLHIMTLFFLRKKCYEKDSLLMQPTANAAKKVGEMGNGNGKLDGLRAAHTGL